MRGLSLRSLGLACWCWVAMAAAGAGAGYAAAGDRTVAQADPGAGAWTAYVYAAERTEAWAAYAAVAAEEAEDAAVLSKYGLMAADTADALAKQRAQAEASLAEQVQLEEAAYAAIALHYAAQTGIPASSDGSAAAGADQSLAAADAAQGPADLSALRAAMKLEEQAGRAARTATWMRRSGSLDAASHLAKQEAYLAARLRTADVREEAVQAQLGLRRTADGSPYGLHDWLLSPRLADDLPLEAGWMQAISRYAAVPYGTGTAAAGSSPPQGERTSTGGKPAATLPLNAVALAGMPVKLAAAPFLTEAGEAYVPLRPYAEALGYRLQWDAKRAALLLTKDEDSIEIRPGQQSVMHNGEAVSLPGAPQAQGGHTYVPLAFFADTAGCDVYWSEEWRQGIIITRANGDVE